MCGDKLVNAACLSDQTRQSDRTGVCTERGRCVRREAAGTVRNASCLTSGAMNVLKCSSHVPTVTVAGAASSTETCMHIRRATLTEHQATSGSAQSQERCYDAMHYTS